MSTFNWFPICSLFTLFILYLDILNSSLLCQRPSARIRHDFTAQALSPQRLLDGTKLLIFSRFPPIPHLYRNMYILKPLIFENQLKTRIQWEFKHDKALEATPQRPPIIHHYYIVMALWPKIKTVPVPVPVSLFFSYLNFLHSMFLDLNK